MALTEYQDLINDLKELLKEIKKDPPNAHPFIVTLPGTNKAYFNVY
jgi:hypothetical protein